MQSEPIMKRLNDIGAQTDNVFWHTLTAEQADHLVTAMERFIAFIEHDCDMHAAHLHMQERYPMKSCPFCRRALFPLEGAY